MRTTLKDSYQLEEPYRAISVGINHSLQHATKRQRQGYVITARNTGWGDCLLSMVGAWYHAYNANKTLVIDWRKSLYLSDPKQNAYAHYFEVRKRVAGVPIIGGNHLNEIENVGPLYSKTWAHISSEPATGHFREQVFYEDLALNQLAEDYNQSSAFYPDCLPWPVDYKQLTTHVLQDIQPRASIKAKIVAFREKYFHQKMIGIHLRYGNGGDIMNHTIFWEDKNKAMQRVRYAIELTIEKYGDDCGIFISTDTREVEETLKKRFPNCIVREKSFRSDGAGELHHLRLVHGVNKEQIETMAEDALIELYLLAECDALIRFPPNSYFTYVASAKMRYRLAFPEDHLMPVIEY